MNQRPLKNSIRTNRWQRASKMVAVTAWGVVSILSVTPSWSQMPEAACVDGSEGRQVRWDKKWQDDARDHDALYTIEKIVKSDAPPLVVIELKAVNSSATQKRTARITRGYAARLFCERMEKPAKEKGVLVAHQGGLRSLKTKESMPEGFPSREVEAGDLVYRTLSHGAWVTANPKSGEQLAVCKFPYKSFSCSTSDAELLAASRSTGEPEEVQPGQHFYKMILPTELLIYTEDSGWIRSEPLGLPTNTIMATCLVGTMTFRCPEQQKSEHLSELKALHALALLYQPIEEEGSAKTPTETNNR